MREDNAVIAAISTALSPSGIGIIRISGDKAVDVIHRIYRSKGGKKDIRKENSHTIHYGFIYDGDDLVDEVLVMLMRAPRTYTGEDTVEIDCHGGIYAMKKVLDTVLKNGAVLAEPGEFTKRAFLNGRLDLSQAEAVMDVIQARNASALKNSLEQLRGSVKEEIQLLRKEILHQIAFIESALDDPEHYDLEGYAEKLDEMNGSWISRSEKLLASSENGKILREGIKTVILGKPNAGKSSLMNLLVGEERAIVTDIAGTTRDTLEEYINLRGISLRMIDTAGIRQTPDTVEKIGVGKALKAAEDADLILYVVDSSTGLDESDDEIINIIRDKKAIVIYNKTDLSPVADYEALRERVAHPIVKISALEKKGMDALEETIQDLFFTGRLDAHNEVFITNARHQALLKDTVESLMLVKDSIEAAMPEDFFSIDLMNAYESLGRIVGESVEDDLVDEIFRSFCMGK